MKLYTKTLEIAVAILLVLGAWWYSGHRAVEAYKKEQALEQAKADKVQQEKYDALAADYEALKTKRAENAKTIIREVEKVVDRPVYRNQCIDADGLRIANEAIESANTREHAPAVQPTE